MRKKERQERACRVAQLEGKSLIKSRGIYGESIEPSLIAFFSNMENLLLDSVIIFLFISIRTQGYHAKKKLLYIF